MTVLVADMLRPGRADAPCRECSGGPRAPQGAVCRPCMVKRTQAWKRDNPEKYQALLKRQVEQRRATGRDRHYILRTKYGIGSDDYDAMLAAQSGLCAGCLKPSAEGERLHVDHCHSTGVVRGLLCRKCNMGIGMADDSPEILRRLARYLETAPRGGAR